MRRLLRASDPGDRGKALRRAGALLGAAALLLSGAASARDLIAKGASAPKFVLRDTAGTAVSCGGARGAGATLIVFASVFCDPCRRALPAVQELHEKYGGRGLDVVAVVLDGETLAEVVDGVLRQEGYTFRAALDEPVGRAYKTAGLYGVTEVPAVVLIDGRGKVALAETGVVPGGELEKAVRSALKR